MEEGLGFFVDLWRDGNAVLGTVSPLVSAVFAIAKWADMPALSHLRDVSYAWALAPLLVWVFIAYVRRWARSVPKLKCSFAMNTGCVTDEPDSSSPPEADAPPIRWYRVKVEAFGSEPINGCLGRLLSVRFNGKEMLEADKPNLGFTPADEPETCNKTLHQGEGVFEYLDVLTANKARGVWPPLHGHISSTVKLDFSKLGDYDLRIGIVSNNAPTAHVGLRFSWTGDPTTSRMIALTK